MAAIVLCTINAKWIHPSLALRLLKANLPPALSRKADDCLIVELALRQPLAEKTAALLAENPAILALSVSIWNHEATLELLAALEPEWNKRGAKPLIVLGGPETTYLPESAELFSYADFVIRGEGEFVFGELCEAVLRDPEGAKKKYGAFIDAAPVNLPAIKSAYDLYTGEDLSHKLIYVESSRGCPYACAFCQSAVKTNGSAALREFPPETFLADLEKLLRHGKGKIRTVKFLDRSFNVHIPRALRILEFCLTQASGTENAIGGHGLQFHFELVPAVFPSKLRTMLARFPPESLRLEIGIQSFNKQTCARINRISEPKKELDILRFLREKTNAVIHADLIAGLPGEDLASFGNGFDVLWTTLSAPRSPAPFEIQLGILKCLPGTPIHDMAETGSFIATYTQTPPYEVIETDCLPMSDMDDIKNFARFWELIVNRNPFPDLLPALVPPGKPVFSRFMELSRQLLSRFGKNWGIVRSDLRESVVLYAHDAQIVP